MQMQPRLRLVLITLVALVVALLAGLVVFDGPATRATHVDPAGFDGALTPRISALDFHLADQDGRRASLGQYLGQPVILTFLYSTCRDTCPLMASQIRGALDELGQRIPALAVSVDPVGDTPLNASRFLNKVSLTGRMRFLLGSRAQLAPIWKAYGVAPQSPASKVSDHSAEVLLVDRRGRQRVAFPADQLTPEGLAHDLRLLEAEPS